MRTEYIVNACGWWGKNIARIVGLELPISLERVQRAVSESFPIKISNLGVMGTSSYFQEQNIDLPFTTDESYYPILMQWKKGELFIGLAAGPGTDKRCTLSAIEVMCREPLTFYPIIKGLQINVIRSFANIYANTPDGLPILGPVQGVKGFIMACGFSDYGIMVGYKVGELLAEQILYKETSTPIDTCYLSRFG